MSGKVVIVDYGVGNFFNLCKAFRHLSISAQISSDPGTVRNADGIVLPGVGNFGEAIKNLKAQGIDSVLRECFKDKKPILGICLGMHVLFEESEEASESGLGLLKGKVERFSADSEVVPLIGWNNISFINQDTKNDVGAQLFQDISDTVPMYFAHSYFVRPFDERLTQAVSKYGSQEFPAAIRKDNVVGLQFHPELSGVGGLSMLRNFFRVTS